MLELALKIVVSHVIILASTCALELFSLYYYDSIKFAKHAYFGAFYSSSEEFLLFKSRVDTMLTYLRKSRIIEPLLGAPKICQLLELVDLLLKASIVQAKFSGYDVQNSGLSYYQSQGDNIQRAFQDLINLTSFFCKEMEYGPERLIDSYEIQEFSHGRHFRQVTGEDIEIVLNTCVQRIYAWQHKFRNAFGQVVPSSRTCTLEEIFQTSNAFKVEYKNLFDQLEAKVAPEPFDIEVPDGVEISEEKWKLISEVTPNPGWIFFKANYLPVEAVYFPMFYFCIYILMPVVLISIMFKGFSQVDISIAYWLSVYFCCLIPWGQVIKDAFGPNWNNFPFDYGYRLHAQFALASLLCLVVFFYYILFVNMQSTSGLESPASSQYLAFSFFAVFPLLLLASIGFEGLYILSTFFFCEVTFTYENLIRKVHIVLALLYIWTLFSLNAVGGFLAIVSFGGTILVRLSIYIKTFETADMAIMKYPFFYTSRFGKGQGRESGDFNLKRKFSAILNKRKKPYEDIWVYSCSFCCVADWYVTPTFSENESNLELGVVSTRRLASVSRLALADIPEKLPRGFRTFLLACGLSCCETANECFNSCSCQGDIHSLDIYKSHHLYVCTTKEGLSLSSTYSEDSIDDAIIIFLTDHGLIHSFALIKRFLTIIFDQEANCPKEIYILADLSSEQDIFKLSSFLYSTFEALFENWLNINPLMDQKMITHRLIQIFEHLKIKFLTKVKKNDAPYNLPTRIYRNFDAAIGKYHLEVQKCLTKCQYTIAGNIEYYRHQYERISLRRYIINEVLSQKLCYAKVKIFALCSTADSLMLKSHVIELNLPTVTVINLCEDDVSSTVFRPSSQALADYSHKMWSRTIGG